MRLTDYPAAAALDGSESLLGVKAGAATLVPVSRLPAAAATFGLTPTALGKWRTALARQRAGQANARIALVGDSTTVGQCAAPSPSTYLAAQPYGRTAALVKHLNAMGEVAQQECFINDGDVTLGGATLPQYDSRIVLGSGWASISPSVKNFGGNNLLNGSDTSTLSFTPAAAFDTIEVIYGKLSGGGSFGVNVDGGASLGAASCSGSAGYGKATFTCALGTHTINITPTSVAAGNFIVGVNTFNSAKKAILVFPIAGSGYRATDFSTGNAPYGAGPNLAVFPADLYVIDLGVNDWSDATDLTAFQTALQLAVTQCAALGSVLLMAGVQSNPTATSAATQASYRTVIAAVAAASGTPCLDMAQAWGGYAQASGFGMMGDNLHPNLAGYSDMAGMIAQTITRRL